MITIQQALFSRLTGDTTLQTLLGGSGRIVSGLDYDLLKSPCIAINNISNVPGDINSDHAQTDVEHYIFRVFADNCISIISRLRILLDRYTFAETSEAGVLRCIWDSDGPDLYDEDLRCRRKDARFRIYSMPKAVGSV